MAVWFVGYTRELSTAVWVGNPSPPSGGYPLANRTIGGRYYSTICGGCLPGPIWRQMMTDALKGVPVSNFAAASSDVVNGKPKPVPSVSGLSVDNAKAVLATAGFVPVVAKRRVFVDYAPQGDRRLQRAGAGQLRLPRADRHDLRERGRPIGPGRAW